MATSFNRVILIGNLCRDPDFRKLPTNTSVAEMRLAVSERIPGKVGEDGRPAERVCYVDVTAWQQQADFCQRYFVKGSQMLVEGRLQYDEWKNQQGETRSKLRVVADRIQFVGPKPQGSAPRDGGAYQPQQQSQAQAPAQPSAQAPEMPPADDPDDLPF